MPNHTKTCLTLTDWRETFDRDFNEGATQLRRHVAGLNPSDPVWISLISSEMLDMEITRVHALPIDAPLRGVPFAVKCAFRRSWAVIPLIVGTPEKRTFWSPPFYAQVVTMGQVLVFRVHHDDGAGSPLSNRVGGHFAATGPAPHRPRSVHPSIRANGPQEVG